MAALPRKRVWIPALLAWAVAVIVSWHLLYEQPMRHLDPALAEDAIGRLVSLKGTISPSSAVVIDAGDGWTFIIDRDVPREIPIGNEVMATGRVSAVGDPSNARRLLRLAGQDIVDLGTVAPPREPPPAVSTEPPLVIIASARQFEWSFTYPNGRTSLALHVPTGRPIQIDLTSADVLHALRLTLPEGRHVQGIVAFPGGPPTSTKFKAAAEGQVRLMCAEYCGPYHSVCGADVIVQSPADFDRWLASEPVPAE